MIESLGTSTHIGWLTAAYNSQFQGIQQPLWPPWVGLCTPVADTHTDIHGKQSHTYTPMQDVAQLSMCLFIVHNALGLIPQQGLNWKWQYTSITTGVKAGRWKEVKVIFG